MSNKKNIIIIQAITPEKTQTYEIDKSEFIFGRGGKSDVIIRDVGISREHLKIKLAEDKILVMDLKSVNGTYIDGHRINRNQYIMVPAYSIISFGKCALTLKVHAESRTLEEQTQALASDKGLTTTAIATTVNTAINHPSQNPVGDLVGNLTSNSTSNSTDSFARDPAVHANNEESKPVVDAVAGKAVEKVISEVVSKSIEVSNYKNMIDLSAFPKTEEEHRLNFKNVGLDLPKYKNPGQHAKEIIEEAEYQKHAIIKSAEVFKSKTINEARILSKKASDESYVEYKKLVDSLLDNTRIELKKLRTDTEIVLSEKRLQANEDIQKMWEEHENQVRIDKEKQYSTFEKENKIKLDLALEKARSDIFAERHKLLAEAEAEILKKRLAYRVEFENEKTEHVMRIKMYTQELQKIQESTEENKKIYQESSNQKDTAEQELFKIMSQLKSEKENLTLISNSFKETQENQKLMEQKLAVFSETRNRTVVEIEKAQEELKNINLNFSNLSEKKQLLAEEIENMANTLKDAKTKAKSEVESTYAHLKQEEAKKFDDYKANQLKELQKIRDAHSDSIKNFSVDLSQEITTKLELLAAKNGYTKFDFEKHFELINSVIQIKGAINTGSESKHVQQLESWKNRKRQENFSLITKGFAAGLICVFLGKMAYDRLSIDPLKEKLARIASENKKRIAENKYTPTKTGIYYDNYVETTLFTENFVDVYLDKNIQSEWVNYATKYFLRQWKIDEEKVIKVISNANALVQNINESIPQIKKTQYKTDIAKLKELEDEYVQQQAAILGTHVKYEAYKKIEKEFFQSKMRERAPAGQ